MLSTPEGFFKRFEDIGDIGECVPYPDENKVCISLFSPEDNQIQADEKVEAMISHLPRLPVIYTELDLSGSFINYLHEDQLSRLIQAIPKHVKKMSLASNCLGTPEKVPLDKACLLLSLVPEPVEELDLSANGFHRSKNTFGSILEAIAPPIKTVDLSFTLFSNMESRINDLTGLRKLPPSVHKVIIKDCEFRYLTDLQRTLVLLSLPDTVTCVIVNDEYVELSSDVQRYKAACRLININKMPNQSLQTGEPLKTIRQKTALSIVGWNLLLKISPASRRLCRYAERYLCLFLSDKLSEARDERTESLPIVYKSALAAQETTDVFVAMHGAPSRAFLDAHNVTTIDSFELFQTLSAKCKLSRKDATVLAMRSSTDTAASATSGAHPV